MPLPSANNVDLYASKESAWGETPSGPTMKQLGYTSESLALQKQTQVSERIRADEMRDEVAHVGNQISGDLGFELAHGEWDDFLESAMGAEFVDRDVTATVTSDSTAGTFVTDNPTGLENIRVGDYIGVEGFAYQGGAQTVYLVIAKPGDNTVTVSPAPEANETSVAGVRIGAHMLANGASEISLLVEKRFAALTPAEFYQYLGCVVNGMNLSIPAGDRATGSFSLLGKSMKNSQSTVAGTSTPSSPKPLMTGSSHIGDLRIDGSDLLVPVLSLDLSIARNLRASPKLSSLEAAGIGRGFMDVTGTMSVYFENRTLYEKLRKHETVRFGFKLEDSDGNFYGVNLPKIHFTDGSPNVPGGNQDLILPLSFQAVRDPALGFQMKVMRWKEAVG